VVVCIPYQRFLPELSADLERRRQMAPVYKIAVIQLYPKVRLTSYLLYFTVLLFGLCFIFEIYVLVEIPLSVIWEEFPS
jgi:hypothetical protein